ncbi:hypothetical protein OG558_37865 [Kribbella sp. NBC_01510]|uniref:hypothetical protein n=1 Tax=Kribbella sp. NBC_01510 TaxID=2903581 RepID=UPI003867FF80
MKLAGRLRDPRAGRGRYGVLRRLLPAVDQRRSDVQGAGIGDVGPADGPMPSQGTGGVIFYERVDYGSASGVDQDLGHAELHRALAERE